MCDELGGRAYQLLVAFVWRMLPSSVESSGAQRTNLGLERSPDEVYDGSVYESTKIAITYFYS